MLHCYLGTRDWAYCPHYDMIAYAVGFANAGMVAPMPPAGPNAKKGWGQLTMQEALNNADSYGGFVSRLRIPL